MRAQLNGRAIDGRAIDGRVERWHLEGGEEDLRRVFLDNARVLFRNAPLPQSQQGR